MKKLDGRWLLGVSGGADSMALLDMCYTLKMDILVAHVNYHKRESANRDEKGVFSYCKKRKIPFFKRDIETYEKGNFQAQARVLRYAFFKELVDTYHCDGVLVAHHEDDVLETYIMQKQRESIPAYYGIKAVVNLYGLLVRRPLLDDTKKELELYCKQHQVSYFVDESNLSNHYTRNKIRHQQIEKMSKSERAALLLEMKRENEQLDRIQKQVEKLYLQGEKLDIVTLLDYEEDLRIAFLRYWIMKQSANYHISNKTIMNIYKQIQGGKNFAYALKDGYTILCSYGKLSIEQKKDTSFSYKVTSLEAIQTPYFKISKSGLKIEGVMVSEKDFPLTIRNYQTGDKIMLRFGSKKVSRFFIDRKIDKQEREVWPVVVNNVGEIIFVCGIGCDIKHYSNNFNMFVVK